MPKVIKIETLDGKLLSKEDIKKGMDVVITWSDGKKCVYRVKKDYNTNDDWSDILSKKIILES